MGTRNFTSFQSNLKFELSQRTDLDSYLDDWVNSAYLDICTRHKFWTINLPSLYMFPELDTSTTSNTEDGEPKISVPLGFLFSHSIWDSTNDKKLDYMPFRAYVKKTGRADTSKESKPTKYTRYGSYLYLYPTPDAAYAMTIYYRQRPTLLSAGTDVTAIGEEWDEPIQKLALIQSLMRLKEYDNATKEKAEWMDMMTGHLDIYKRQEADRDETWRPDYMVLEGYKY